MENEPIKTHRWLYPLSLLYGLIVEIRNSLFNMEILPSRSFQVPIISVGNITVGGTGKTPHTEYLIRLLQKDFKVAVLSRGYKRKSKGYILANEQSTMEQIGDEPFQMKSKYPDIYMAVDKNRCHGIEELSKERLSPQTDIILLDDAYQHRYVQPGINILLTDYHRPLKEDTMLPAGRLREPAREKNRANIVIVTKCPTNLNPMDFRVIIKCMDLHPFQKLYFTTLKYGELTPLFTQAPRRALTTLAADEEILLLTGIASPQQLISDLSAHATHITPISFPDHHHFNKKDAKKIEESFGKLKSDKRLIITTEKDATRLMHLPLSPEIRKQIYVLPIEVEFLLGKGEQFNQDIINYVRTNSRNNILSKK